MPLTLSLSKPGDKAAKLSLNLNKDEKFTAKLLWDGGADLDLHALLCVGVEGGQASITSLDQILSTYNVRRKIAGSEVGVIDKNADGTFEIYQGALVHSADAIDGNLDGVDEWIRVDPARIPKKSGEFIEIPLIAMIHPQSGSQTFANVRNAQVQIVNSRGDKLLDIGLSAQFGPFIGVQMGSIMIDSNGKAEFSQVGSGFMGDFNSVIEHFG